MLNPVAVWLSALTLAFLASSATGLPWLIGACAISLVAITIRVRKTQVAFPKLFVTMALIVIVIRVGFRVIFSSTGSSDAGWRIPSLQLNLGFLGELHLFGFLSVDSLIAGLTDGFRLAAIILSIGMASILVNARTLLRYTPAALYELSTALAISINLAPQLIKSLARAQRARQLRGRSRKVSLLASIVIPVLEDTIDQSLALAASMDSRGFGYLKPQSRVKVRNLIAITFVLLIIAIYLLLTNQLLAAFLLTCAAITSTVLAVSTAGKNSIRTRAIALSWSTLDRVFVFALVGVVALRASGWWQP